MKKSTFTKFFFILWVLLWILAFIFIPSRVDFIHGGTFGDFKDFPQKLESFNITAAITDALFSFCAASLLTLVYLILGSGVFRLLTKKFFFDEKISILNWLGLASTSFVLGHAVFSFIFILLGDKHLLEAKYIWMILLVGTLSGVSSLIILYKKIPASTNNRIATLWNQAKQKVILTLTAVILLLGLFYSATRLSYDAVAFYFFR